MKKNKKTLGIEHKSHRVSFAQPEFGVDFHWSYNNFTTKHEHDFYEFVIITEGKMHHIHNTTKTIVSTGMFFVIKPEEYHQLLPIKNKSSKHVCFSITPDTLEKIMSTLWQNDAIKKLTQSLPCVVLPKNIWTNIFNLIERINQCTQITRNNIHLLIKSAIIELLTFLMNYLEPAEMLQKETNPPEWLNTFLNM